MMRWLKPRTERDGRCMVWKGATQNARDISPKAGKMVDGESVSINVRRCVWELKTGEMLPRTWVVVCTCDTERCVEPRCLAAMSRTELQAGRKISAAHRVRLTLAARARRSSKLTDEAVLDIRFGAGTETEKAERHGVTVKYVRDLLAYRWRKELRSPFAGLLAANESTRRAA